MPVITRKIELIICDYDKNEKKYLVAKKGEGVYENTWKEINKLNNNCSKVANLITTKLYTNTNGLKENFTTKAGERDYPYGIGLDIAKELKLDFKGYTEVLTRVCGSTFKKLKNDKGKILKGEVSITNYKKGSSFPFSSSKKRFVKQNSDYFITILGLHFKLNFGRDRSNNKHIVEEIVKTNYKFCDSSIEIKKGKIFLALAVDIPEKNILLDKNICLGVDLGMSVPAYLALNSNPHYRKRLGNFTHTKTRIGIKDARERTQKLDIGVSGKGRKHKNKKIEMLKKSEKKYCNTYEHQIAKWIVDEAIKHNAGTIKLENLSGFDKPYTKRFWGYYGYQTKIEYKAKKYGIDVVYIDPKNTSKTCNKCGHVNEQLDCENKNKQMNKKREWTCQNCSQVLQRDWNAAYNIANSINYLKK